MSNDNVKTVISAFVNFTYNRGEEVYYEIFKDNPHVCKQIKNIFNLAENCECGHLRAWAYLDDVNRSRLIAALFDTYIPMRDILHNL